jgi:hypothetical protein
LTCLLVTIFTANSSKHWPHLTQFINSLETGFCTDFVDKQSATYPHLQACVQSPINRERQPVRLPQKQATAENQLVTVSY